MDQNLLKMYADSDHFDVDQNLLKKIYADQDHFDVDLRKSDVDPDHFDVDIRKSDVDPDHFDVDPDLEKRDADLSPFMIPLLHLFNFNLTSQKL